MVGIVSQASKRTLVIIGATGKQGGSVVKSILGDPKAAAQFHVKAVTRDVTKDSAKALEAAGAEVVAADLNDKSSLSAVIKGAYGVFAVTNFWEKMDAKVEEAQGQAIADVCKEEDVQHLVWSSLPNVNKLSNGVLSQVHHFDSKARVEDYIRAQGVPASFFLPGFFMSNIPGASLRQLPTGNYGLALPMGGDAPIPLFNAEGDTGKWVKAMFLKPETVLGKHVLGASGYFTPTEIVDTFKKLYPTTGATAGFNRLPDAVFKGILAQRGMPEPVQEEMLQNMRLMPEFGYYGGESLDFSLSILDEAPTTWEQYAKAAPAFANLS